MIVRGAVRAAGVEVFNGGELAYGEVWDYCDECGAILAKGGEVIDGDGFEGLCAGCADKAKAENTDPGFDDHLSPVSFARVDRGQPGAGPLRKMTDR